MTLTRRTWLKRALTAGAAGVWSAGDLHAARAGGRRRVFEVCLAPPVLEGDPALLETVREAGVGTVWIVGHFYGHEPYPPDLMERARRRVLAAGL